MRRLLAALVASALTASCQQRSSGLIGPDAPLRGGGPSIFAEDFESGTLADWQDGVDPARHRIVTDSTAQSGRRYLVVTYPAGRDGGWLTHFLPAYDSLYLSYYVRFPSNWQGGTKLVALYGSRTDDQWSGFGKAGICPSGTDFFTAMLVTELGGSPGPMRFYTYYPAMAREPDGVTCWGRYGNGTGSERTSPAVYAPSLTLSRGTWHHIEFFVQLNTPDQADGRQVFWVDGMQWGSWSSISFRSSAVLALNAVQLTFSTGAAGVPQTQELSVDNLVVRSAP
jgi:hypothetical protein